MKNWTLTFVPQTGEEAFYGLPYKEPFAPIENGFGYLGVLLGNKDGTRVQCHVCGNWAQSLGSHMRIHKMNAKEYKLQFGLKPKAALVCETIRIAMSASAFNRTKISVIDWKEHMAAIRNGKNPQTASRRELGWRCSYDSPQWENEHGNCRLQLLFRLKALARKLKAPNVSANVIRRHDSGLLANLRKKFGSLNAAKRAANLLTAPCRTERTIRAASVINDVKRYYKQYNRIPSQSDVRRASLIASGSTIAKLFGTHNNMIRICELTPNPQHGLIDLPTIELIKQYSSGLTATAIAARYGVVYATIIKRLRDNGIAIRPSWWYQKNNHKPRY